MKKVVNSFRGYTPGELSALFSNLSKGCEKQYRMEMAGLYGELASYYAGVPGEESTTGFEGISARLQDDLDALFPPAREISTENSDRGALRALKWADKVSRIVKSQLGRFATKGSSFFRDTNIYVCEICGFLFVGDEPPEVCPVCKVPRIKMMPII